MGKKEKFMEFILERFQIERKKFDRSGVYAYTQRILAYNSNKIEGSTLTEEQTASLFDSGILPKTDDFYRAKDVEEMNGHFLMFNKMLDTLEEPLTQELIKAFHYELKSGVFEDRANGYAIGDYKKRPNMIGMYTTVKPDAVADEMEKLLAWYHTQKVDLSVLAEFHGRYESIHPFQDGNGRTARLLSGYIMDLKGRGCNGIGSLEEYIAYDIDEYYESIQMGLHAMYYYGSDNKKHKEIRINYIMSMVKIY